jgi:hypothetical protein
MKKRKGDKGKWGKKERRCEKRKGMKRKKLRK